MNRTDLACLVREALLCGHLIDRAGMPYVIGEFGREVMAEIAIDEWQGASPIYSLRTKELLNIGGNSVATIFKCMQFDIGAPPQFLDFRYRVVDDHHGSFELAHCGALMDVEPMGEDFVHTMCHTIEDPTFPATAAALNPLAAVTPIHRPPRRPSDRQPHCAWQVDIDPSREPVPWPLQCGPVESSYVARLPLRRIEPGEGMVDYSGRLVEDVDLERFSESVLRALFGEVAIQCHLLGRSFMLAVQRRSTPAMARRLGRLQLLGWSGVTARRLVRAFDVAPDLNGLSWLVAYHLAFQPAEGSPRIECGSDELVIDCSPLGDCSEDDGLSYWSLLADDPASVVDVIAHECDPRLVVSADGPVVRVVRGEEPRDEHEAVTMAAFSTGIAFRFAQR